MKWERMGTEAEGVETADCVQKTVDGLCCWNIEDREWSGERGSCEGTHTLDHGGACAPC